MKEKERRSAVSAAEHDEDVRAESGKVKNDFSKGTIWKHIVTLAIPLTVAQLVQILYNIVDRIYIGHLAGTDGLALTGIGLTFPIITFINAFTQLFGIGGAPLSAIARGEGDNDKAERIMGTSMALLICASVILMILGYTLAKPILYLFGASDATFPYAASYIRIYLAGTIFVMISLGMNSYINSQGFAKIGMVTTVVGAALNIALDPLFIFVFKMGVRGAALATVLSQLASFIWVMVFMLGDKPILKLRKEYLKIDWKIAGRISGLGLTGFMMAGTNSAVQIACNKMLSIYGGDLYLGAMTVLNSVREMVSLPVTGLTEGAKPVISFNYGAKAFSRVKDSIKFQTIVGITYTALVWILVLVIPGPIFRMFSNEPQLVEIGIHSLIIYFFGFVFMSLQFCGQASFVALGKAKQAVFFSIFRKIVIVVPLTILLPIWMGVDGVFWAEPISNVIGGAACFLTMYFTVWRKLGKEKV